MKYVALSKSVNYTAGDLLANLLWQESERSLWTTMEYLETAVSETVAGSKFACSDVSKFISVSPFAYPDIHFSISFTALVNKGREETD